MSFIYVAIMGSEWRTPCFKSKVPQPGMPASSLWAVAWALSKVLFQQCLAGLCGACGSLNSALCAWWTPATRNLPRTGS